MAEKRAEIDASVSRLLAIPEPDLVVLADAASIYGALGLPQKQKTLEDRILAVDSHGRPAERVLMSRITAMSRDNTADVERFRDALRTFLAREPI